MEEQHLKYIELLERALASFYETIKERRQFNRIRSVLEFMQTHSEGHADLVAEELRENPAPHLDVQEILHFQNMIVKDAEYTILNERDELEVLDKLAYGEEALGDFYKKIASTLEEISHHCARVAGIISKIGDDEYNHRDILLHDKSRLARK